VTEKREREKREGGADRGREEREGGENVGAALVAYRLTTDTLSPLSPISRSASLSLSFSLPPSLPPSFCLEITYIHTDMNIYIYIIYI
jgi:hypothetical protein